MPEELLQHSDLLQDIDVLLLVQLVLEQKAVRIPGSHIDKGIVELKGVYVVVELELQLAQGIDDL